MTPTNTYQKPDGTPCRDYEAVAVIDNRREALYGTACRQPDGSWENSTDTDIATSNNKTESNSHSTCGSDYVVRRGDTLSKIARQCGLNYSPYATASQKLSFFKKLSFSVVLGGGSGTIETKFLEET